MSFTDVMQNILAPTNGYQPGVTHDENGVHQCFGAPRMRKGRPDWHEGVDLNYEGLGPNGINQEHPPVGAPVDGEVVSVGGDYNTVTIRDAFGNLHQILHLNSTTVQIGDYVIAGAQIGYMGGVGPSGPNNYAQHVHYQIQAVSGGFLDPALFHDLTGQGGCPPLDDDAIEPHRNKFSAAKVVPSPLVFDLDGDGIETTAPRQG